MPSWFHKHRQKVPFPPNLPEQHITANNIVQVPNASHSRDGQRWIKAAEQLREHYDTSDIYAKLVETLQDLSSPSTTIYTNISTLLNAKSDEVTDRQWKLRWGSHNIRVRTIVDSISSVLGTVKDVGTTAASLDPLHAGIPVAVFCAILPLLNSLSSQEDAAAGGIEAIGGIVNYYIAFEEAIDRELAGQYATSLDEALSDLYALVLEFMVVAICFFQHKTLTRYLRAVPKLDDFDKLLRSITQQDSACRKLIATVQQSETREQVEQIRNITQEILDRSKARGNDNDHILIWLSDVKYGADQQFIFSKICEHYSGSGEWLRQSAQYRHWQKPSISAESVMWLRGHVGTGKTSVTSILIQQHLQRLQASSIERVAYVFCSNKAKVHDPLRFVKCLISQLAWNNDGRSIHKLVTQLYEKRNDPAGSGLPNVGKYALDECCEEELDTMMEILDYIVTHTNSQVSLFLTSRMHVRVLDFFPNSLIIGPAGNQDDVLNLIKTEMNMHRDRILGGTRPDLEHRLLRVLAERSENVFRWVELEPSIFLSRKSRLIHPKDVEIKIAKLESDDSEGIPDLNEVYGQIYEMNTPQPEIRRVADATMRWLLLAHVSPHNDTIHQAPRQAAADMAYTNNVLAAVALQTDGSMDTAVTKSLVLDSCSNLVLEDEREETFYFAHYSVVEYLVSRTDRVTGARDMTVATVSSIVVLSSLSLLVHLVDGLASPTFDSNFEKPVPRKRPSLERRNSSYILPRRRITFHQFALVFWPLYYLLIPAEDRSGELKALFSKVMLTKTPSEYFSYWHMNYGKQLWGGMNRLRHQINEYKQQTPGRSSLPEETPTSFTNPATLVSAKGQSPSRAFAVVVFDLMEVMQILPEAELKALNMEGRNCLALAEAWQRVKLAKFLREERKLSPVVSSRLRSDQMGLHIGKHAAYAVSPSIGNEARKFNDQFRWWDVHGDGASSSEDGFSSPDVTDHFFEFTPPGKDTEQIEQGYNDARQASV